MDVISGSYSPGHVFVFAQQEDGAFAKKEKINDQNGKPIKVGYAAHVYAADWDNDEDLDLIIGNISGEVYLVRNEGKAGENLFGQAEPLSAGEERIRVGHGDAGPVLADWDSDGLLDLIVGAGDGSVILYPNTGTKTEPALGEGRELIAASQRDEQAASCGRRTKVCVTDFNGDGQLDLLVGDFASVREKQLELTPEQQEAADAAQKEYDAVLKEYQAALEKTELQELSKQYQQLRNAPDGETPEEAKARDAKVEKLLEQIQEIQEKELGSFRDKLLEVRQRLPRQKTTYHGFVWLYPRRPGASE